MLLTKIKKIIKKEKNSKLALKHAKFFKTAKGEYGEGDLFLGVTVPKLREIAKKHRELQFNEIKKLLNDKYHENRFMALLILINDFQTAKEEEREKITNFYLANLKKINNWDLVDLSAPKILGKYLITQKNHDILYKLGSSSNIWEKRIAIISTLPLIKNNDFTDLLNLAKKLIKDKNDLIQKAIGWMLREIGKKNQTILESFLAEYSQIMPRTMLRYSIEKFPPQKRKLYLIK